MLWLALHFPRLALEQFATRGPAAVVHDRRLYAVDAAAQAHGLAPGMRLSDALGLLPQLQLFERQRAGERALLDKLACWAGQYSSHVSQEPPQALLVEIGASLRLFGGAAALCAHISAGASAQGLSHSWAYAPTAQAALWGARAGLGEHSPQSTPALASALAALPLTVLELPPRQAEQMALLGFSCLGDLMRQARAGLIRRFGATLPGQLACALGEAPEVRRLYSFPERFEQALELPAKLERSEMLRFGAQRLVLALAGWLHARAAGIECCTLELAHEDLPPSVLKLGFSALTRDPARIARVLRERLEAFKLPAAATALRLRADAPQALAGASGGLFGEAATGALGAVIERLRARLGEAAVQALVEVPDHRPECASAYPPQAPATPSLATTARLPSRPLWLLQPAVALREQRGHPQHGGPLQRLTRAERIESGWWDAPSQPGDIQRDYFIARNPQGEWLWIYRDAQGWWLHGQFA